MDTDVSVAGLSAPADTGYSSETIMFSAAWAGEEGPREEDLVLRTAPLGPGVFPSYDLVGQARTIMEVDELGVVPVPSVRWVEDSGDVIEREFFIMDHVDGSVPPDNLPYTMEGWLLESAKADQARLEEATVRAIVALHEVDTSAGRFDFLDRPEFGLTGLDQQIGYYRNYLDYVFDGNVPSEMGETFSFLIDTKPDSSGSSVLNWGDSRPG